MGISEIFAILAFLFSVGTFIYGSLLKGKLVVAKPSTFLIRLVGDPQSTSHPIIVVPVSITNTGAVVHTVNYMYGILRSIVDLAFGQHKFVMSEEYDSLLPKSKHYIATTFAVAPRSSCCKILSFHCMTAIDNSVIVPFLSKDFDDVKASFLQELQKKPETEKLIIKPGTYVFDIYAYIDRNELSAVIVKTLEISFNEVLLWSFYTEREPVTCLPYQI